MIGAGVVSICRILELERVWYFCPLYVFVWTWLFLTGGQGLLNARFGGIFGIRFIRSAGYRWHNLCISAVP